MKYPFATRTFFVLLLSAATPIAGAMTLTPDQQVRVLAEAQGAFDAAARMEATHPAAARTSYAQSAEKFQLLADTGPRDGELYRRLAEACLHSGQLGKAIANFQRAEQLLGPSLRIGVGLATARHLRDHDENAPVLPTMTLMEKLALWNRSLSLPWRFRIGLIAWMGVWAALGASLLICPRAFRVSACVCGVVFALLAASLVCDLLPGWNRTRGVVTAPAATLRRGNGETFPAQCAAPLKDGAEFDLIERRGRWVRVLLPDGNTGWLDAEKVELLPPRHTLWS